MSSLKPETKYLKVQISADERDQAKKLAKSKGMTFAGWLGNLVKSQLVDSAATDLENIIPNDSTSSGIRDSLQS